MNLQEFIDNHYEDGEVYSEEENIKFKCVYKDEEINHKRVTYTEVFHLLGTEEYFEVSQDNDNSGYWSDGERYDPEFRKVKPVQRVITVYEAT